MGCVSSKQARSRSQSSPAFDDVSVSSSRSNRSLSSAHLSSCRSFHVQVACAPLEKIKEEPDRVEVVAEAEAEAEEENEESGKTRHDFDDHSGDLATTKKGTGTPQQKAVSGITFGRLVVAEHVAAGWPAWLSAVAGEAIEGWLPLRSDSFERLEKIGQGTYSDVYHARDLKTGKMVAIKKVRFDNFQAESISFMAREIVILRKLGHQNIMKLEGIIASRFSCSIYLVFEYMEHDLCGLLSCPDIKFTESQIKCYMHQLLTALEHCHSRGIMHRDIKSSNILVNNEGILKIADFGLANFMRPKNKEPLTSRVVTLWYRPPELLLGSTDYGEEVDLWSVGCVFCELFLGKPFLKGRTEVEQLHRIFKLCGSPPDDYWKRTRLPLATMFKPQQPYESTLRERCKEFPKSAVALIETFLSIEPSKRGTASSALKSEYFQTRPYACDPASLPQYPPNKEIDAKIREDERRKKASATTKSEVGSRNPRRTRRTLHESSDLRKVIPTKVEAIDPIVHRNHGGGGNAHRRRGSIESRASLKQSYDTKSEVSQASQTQESRGSSIRSVPPQVTPSNSFAWDKRKKQPDVFTRLSSQPISRFRKPNVINPSSIFHEHNRLEADCQENYDSTGRSSGTGAAKHGLHREHTQPDSNHSSDNFESQELPADHGNNKKGRGGVSGALAYQPQEAASRNHDRAHHRSRFYRD